jgi:hypothetical protein
MNLRSAAAVLLLSLIVIESAHGALSLASLGNQTEDFNFLASSGDNIAWVNIQGSRSTTGSPGWYWQNTASNSNDTPYDADNGNTNHGTSNSYGSNSSSDRAMGNIADNGNANAAWGVVFQNNSGNNIVSVTVTYTGEQWRRNNSTDEVLSFAYTSSATDITDFVPALGAIPSGWNAVSALNFVPPISGGGAALDGNASGNRLTKSTTINVSVLNGQYLALRWHDGNSNSSDMGMGIDDLTVSFSAVPEPAAVAFGCLICVVAGLTMAGRRFASRNGACSKS